MTQRIVSAPVLIIGAGPSGMVSALCLAQRGVDCVLVERREGPETHPKAHELSARSIEILHELGFAYDELSAEASPADDAAKVLFCGTISEEFGCIDLRLLRQICGSDSCLLDQVLGHRREGIAFAA